MATVFKQIKNNAKSLVNLNVLNNTTTTTTIGVEDGSRFPTPGNGFYVTVWNINRYFDPSDDPNMRIGLCTARSGNNLTITWGQESTPIIAIKGRPIIALLITDKTLQDAYDAINSIETVFPTKYQEKITVTVGSNATAYQTDGVADNVQLQAALDAVHAAGGGIVEITSPLYIANMITLYPDVNLLGHGDITPVAIASSFAAGVAFRENSGAADYLTIDNLTVDLSAKVDVGGIHIYQGNYVRLSDVHVRGQTYSSQSKWAVRIGNYVSGSPDGTASHGARITNLRVTGCNCGTYEQLLFVNQQDARIVNPYFEGNTNSLAYELMLYINNKNVVVENPHFENSTANSMGMMESEGISITGVTANFNGNYKLLTIINTANINIDGVEAKNTVSSPTTPLIEFFDRTLGPDGFTQIVDDTANVRFLNMNVNGWKYVASCQNAGTILGTDYTMNQNDVRFQNLELRNIGTAPFIIGADSSSNNLHDWDFVNVRIKSWSGTNTGAYQLRGYTSSSTQMYNFRFSNCTIPASLGVGSNAAIRAISMVVESVDNCTLTGTFTTFGALSTATSGSFKKVRSLPSIFNVNDFGAKGDGTTNDSAAIKAAMDTANLAGGGIVQLMPGIHAVGSSISGQYKNITVRGIKGLTTLKATASFSNGQIDLDASTTYVSNVTIEDCIFDQNNQTNVVGVSIKGGTYSAGAYAQAIRFNRVSFKNLGTIDLGHITIYSGRGSTDRGAVSDVRITDCDFQDTVKYHIYISGGQVEDLRILGNKFRNSQYGCIAYNQPNKSNNSLAAARSHKDWFIEDNRFTNNHLSAIALGSQIGLIHDSNKTGVRNLNIRRNYFGASMSTISHYCINVHSNLGLDISNNTFDQSRTAMSIGQSNNGPWYQEDGSQQTTISFNRFYRCFNIADLDSSFFAIWFGNKFIEVTYGGLTPYSRQTPSIYESNFFYNTPTDITGATVQRAALSVVANGSTLRNNTIIDDRLLSNPTTAPVLSQVSGGALGARTYYAFYTWENDSGETQKSAESSFSVSANNLLKVTHPYATTYGPPTGAKKVNWYVSTTAGTGTKQGYTPTPWQQEYEILATTFGALSWTEPTTGLISGTAAPVSNTTTAIMLNGIYEVSGGSGPLIPNFYEDNKFFGNFTPISKQSAYKRVQKNNYSSIDMTSGNLKLVEAIPYTGGNITGAVSFDTVNGEVQTFTLTGNVTATMVSGQYVGQRLERRFTNSAAFTYTKGSNEKLVAGAITITGTTNLIQEWDGTNWNEVSRQVNLS